MSVVPPGGNGTMICTGRDGYVCAFAVAARNENATSKLLNVVRPRLEVKFTQGVLAQLGLLHLAARGHTDRFEVVDDSEVARHAEVGAPRLRPFNEVRFRHGLAGLQRDVGAGDFPEPR